MTIKFSVALYELLNDGIVVNVQSRITLVCHSRSALYSSALLCGIEIVY